MMKSLLFVKGSERFMEPKVAIFVCSCDHYSDLWPTVISGFEMHWPDCPYDIYLHANNITEYDTGNENIKLINTGNDLDWSTNLVNAIVALDYDYFLMWIDDAFLRKPVNAAQLDTIIQFVSDKELDGLKLRKHPKLQHYEANNIGYVPPDSPYRLTVFGVIWKKAALLRALKKGENPWEFEIKGSYRNPDLRIYALSYDFFSIFHGVVKGKWVRGIVETLQRNGYRVESTRPQMNIADDLTNRLKNLRAIVFHALPFQIRNRIIKKRWKAHIDL